MSSRRHPALLSEAAPAWADCRVCRRAAGPWGSPGVLGEVGRAGPRDRRSSSRRAISSTRSPGGPTPTPPAKAPLQSRTPRRRRPGWTREADVPGCMTPPWLHRRPAGHLARPRRRLHGAADHPHGLRRPRGGRAHRPEGWTMRGCSGHGVETLERTVGESGRPCGTPHHVGVADLGPRPGP